MAIYCLFEFNSPVAVNIPTKVESVELPESYCVSPNAALRSSGRSLAPSPAIFWYSSVDCNRMDLSFDD